MIPMPLPAAIEVVPPAGALRASVTIPGSKSITNRALILGALGDGTTEVRGALWSDDTVVMVEALRTLGIGVEVAPDPGEPTNRVITVSGAGGRLAPGGSESEPVEIYVANAGTTTRFLMALLCLGDGAYRLSGTRRMHERPQRGLIDALRELGYRVDSPNGCLPVVVHGGGQRAGSCRVSIEESSQFASALLLCTGVAAWDVTVEGENGDESPYVAMTIDMLKDFPRHGGTYQVEGDASSGSYLVAARVLAAMVAPEPEPVVEIRNWPTTGAQFDERFAAVADAFVAGNPPDALSRTDDLGDSIMTAMVLAPFAQRPTQFTGLARLRVQESDRVAAMQTELTKCGARVEVDGDVMTVFPSALHGARIDTYDDHRIAMCFGALAMVVPGMVINDPACVSKTFPSFWAKLAEPQPGGLGATIRDATTGAVLDPAGLVVESA